MNIPTPIAVCLTALAFANMAEAILSLQPKPSK